MKKRFAKHLVALILALLTCMSLMAVPAAAAAEREVRVRVNGWLVDFPDQKPYVNADGRTLIPVRFVAEELGATVYWDKTIKGAVIEKDGMKIELPIGEKEMTVTHADGKVEVVTMNTAAVLKNGRTLVPIRFVAEAMGCYVDFSSSFQTVQIYKDVLTPEEIKEIRQLQTTRDWSEEKLPFKDSSTPWADLNEYIFQESNDFWKPEEVYIDYIPTPNYVPTPGNSGCTGWNNKDGNIEELANYIVRRAQKTGVTFYSPMFGVEGEFRTDASAIVNHTNTDCLGPFTVYGYLTVTFDEDADIAGWRKMNRLAAEAMGYVQRGKSYTYLVEVYYHAPPTGIRYPICMGIWNRTNGVRERMF